LHQALTEIFGDDRVLTGEAERGLYSQDVFREGELAAFVVRPSSVEQIQALARLANEKGCPLVPRGGGMSYTSGIVPVRDDSVVIDLGDFNRVLEINKQDMTVTVEAGCTWSDLYEALRPTGLRTTYWGTLSGLHATVGGSVSQNSIFWGSGEYGTAADNVLGMDVVLADGSLLSTGAGAQRNSSHFMRQFGPDITGLFTCDCSALGIKARVTLRLVPQRAHRRFVSVSFSSFDQQQQAMCAVSRSELASECFGFDPFLQSQRMRRESLAKDVKALTGVMKSAGGFGKALKEGARVALAGRNFIDEQDWSLHLMMEDHSQAGADQREAAITELVTQAGGKVVENTIPKVLGAHPFGPVNNMVGPEGERWVPVHALVPHSKAQQVYQLTEEIFDRHRSAIEEHDIGVGYLLATVSTTIFVLEPVFFWPDELKALHRASLEPAHLKKLPGFPENLEARSAVTAIRQELVEAYEMLGASHLQMGKAYHYQQGMRPESLALVRAIKDAVDPRGIINPGVLGFVAQ
jgi:hypothetical protein